MLSLEKVGPTVKSLEETLDKNYTAGLNWLINSGIQDREKNDTYGGFYAWYDLDKKQYPFIYSEITGYALNLLISYKKKVDLAGLDESISAAADFLINKAFDDKFGAIKWKYEQNRGWNEVYWTFDNFIVANALINKYRLDKDVKALDVAQKILNTLISKFYFGSGLYSRYISASNSFLNEPLKWSTCFGSYHAKIAIPLLNYYDLTKKKEYLAFTLKILAQTLKFQDLTGRFITDKNNDSTFLHPHFYTLEGYLAADIILKNTQYHKIVENGIKWASHLILNNGGLAGFYVNGDSIKKDSPDINAQYLRCLILFKNRFKKVIFQNILKRTLDFQVFDTNNIQVNGGFKMGDIWFYDHNSLQMGQLKQHINTWATIFVLNTLFFIKYSKFTPFDLC